jgi:hypothetical protein
MGFKVVEVLSPNEKRRRAKEWTEWLIEEKFITADQLVSEESRNALLEAKRLLNELQQELDKAGQNNSAMSKLAANTQEILNNIKL